MQAPESNDSAWRPGREGLLTRDLRETLEEVGIRTWSLDPRTGRVTASENCRRVLGVPARLLSDQDAFETVVYPEDRAARASAISGAIRWMRSQGRAERGRGPSAPGLRGIVYCIDPRRQAEARLQRLQADLIHVARLSATGEMAVALAHELNQPLGAISIYAAACDSLLAEPGPNRIAPARDALAAATGQAQRAGAIIRRLRDFVTRGETERRSESVAGLIGEACDLALVEAREQGVVTRIDPGPPGIRVFADRAQIQEVLVNLIRNAREAMLDGAPRLGDRCRPAGCRRGPHQRLRQWRGHPRGDRRHALPALRDHEARRDGGRNVGEPVPRACPWRPVLGRQPRHRGRHRPFHPARGGGLT